MTAVILRANTELVAVTWLKTIVANAGTTLPEDTSSWAADGFAVASIAGPGARDPYIRMRNPAVRVDTWAVKPGSTKPPWAKAVNLAETIGAACETPVEKVLTLPNNFPSVHLYTATVRSDPQRVPDADSGYARYTMVIQFNWSPVTV